MRHASHGLRPWDALTRGAPAALAPPAGARELAGRLAALVGSERALLGPSTLHIFWDLMRILSSAGAAIFLDGGAYPVGRWGVERAAARGVPVRTFRHHDAASLEAAIGKVGRSRRPIVVTDGFCPGCGRPAPLRRFLEIARRRGGLLVIDDTQALGILGSSPGSGAPYGRGGGGSLRHAAIFGPDIILVSSLAKGFGAPLALVAGGAGVVERFEREAETLEHSSPPSMAAIRAAEAALERNQEEGDELRRRLSALVGRLQRRVRAIGLDVDGGVFPVQSLRPPRRLAAAALHARLKSRGIEAVLHRPRRGRKAPLSFLINADHDPEAIDALAGALAELTGRRPTAASREPRRRRKQKRGAT